MGFFSELYIEVDLDDNRQWQPIVFERDGEEQEYICNGSFVEPINDFILTNIGQLPVFDENIENMSKELYDFFYKGENLANEHFCAIYFDCLEDAIKEERNEVTNRIVRKAFQLREDDRTEILKNIESILLNTNKKHKSTAIKRSESTCDECEDMRELIDSEINYLLGLTNAIAYIKTLIIEGLGEDAPKERVKLILKYS